MDAKLIWKDVIYVFFQPKSLSLAVLHHTDL